MFLKLLVAAAAIITIAQYASCSPSGPAERASITELTRTPARFDGKTVTVTGRVTERVSLMGAGGFRLAAEDGTGLLVLGLASPPKVGEQATVTGSFRMTFAVGAYDAAVVLAR
jgi:hypothetical protein